MLDAEKTTKWFDIFADKIIKNKTYLSDLDQAIGDGDHGANMARGTAAMKEALNGKSFSNAQDILKAAAMSLLSKVGGASGPLYGSALIAMAKAAADEKSTISSIIEAGAKGIQKRGKAEAGDKTMVDVWLPVTESLKKNALTQQVIEQAVESTKPLQAKKGRASYLGERSIGHIDPGSASSGYLFEAMLEAGVLNE